MTKHRYEQIDAVVKEVSIAAMMLFEDHSDDGLVDNLVAELGRCTLRFDPNCVATEAEQKAFFSLQENFRGTLDFETYLPMLTAWYLAAGRRASLDNA